MLAEESAPVILVVPEMLATIVTLSLSRMFQTGMVLQCVVGSEMATANWTAKWTVTGRHGYFPPPSRVCFLAALSILHSSGGKCSETSSLSRMWHCSVMSCRWTSAPG
jgi:hypothetical protein